MRCLPDGHGRHRVRRWVDDAHRMGRGTRRRGTAHVARRRHRPDVGASGRPSPPASTATATPFTIPAERLAALDAAGIDLDIGAAYPAQPADVPWPTQDWPTGDPVGADQDAINLALLTAFDNPGGEGGIDAVLVVQDGKLVVEHYKAGYDPDAAHISWSMAKSITGTMIGMLVAAGQLDPMAPADVPGVGRSERSPPRDHHRRPAAHALGPASGTRSTRATSDVIEMLFGSRHGRSRPLRRRASRCRTSRGRRGTTRPARR